MSGNPAEKAQPAGMMPPTGFIEQAVGRALARIAAEEALRELPIEGVAENDARAERRRHDSGMIRAIDIDDAGIDPNVASKPRR